MEIQSYFPPEADPPLAGNNISTLFSFYFYFISLFCSCATSYNYYPPPVNSLSQSNRGELNVGGLTGITGSAVEGAIAPGNHIALRALLHNGKQANYRSFEQEYSISISTYDSSDSRLTLSAGSGFGNNYKRLAGSYLEDFKGHITRPFVMLTFGTATRHANLGKKIYGDASLSVLVNYLHFNGAVATTQNGISMQKEFNAKNIYYEPVLNLSIGGGMFRAVWSAGIPFKKRYDFEKNLTVFPFETHIGLLLILGRKYERK